MYVLLGSWVRDVDINRRGEENSNCRRIPSADEMAAQQTGWEEPEESAEKNQEQGTAESGYSVYLWLKLPY